MVLLKLILCFLNQVSRCSLSGRLYNICSHFNTVRNILRTNHNTSHDSSPNHNTSLLASQALTISNVYDPSFALLDPSREAWDSSVNKIFKKSTFMLLSTLFRRFFTCIFIYRGVVTSLTDIPTFFLRQYRVVLGTVGSSLHLKSSPLVNSWLFTASNLIRERRHWETTIEWPLMALRRNSVGDAITFSQFCDIFRLFFMFIVLIYLW